MLTLIDLKPHNIPACSLVAGFSFTAINGLTGLSLTQAYAMPAQSSHVSLGHEHSYSWE